MRLPSLSDLLSAVDQTRQLRPLAPGAGALLGNTAVIAALSVPDGGGSGRRRPLPITVTYRGTRLRFEVTNRSEVEVLKEMLVQEQYAIDEMVPPQIILDLGSNIGASIAYFRTHYPEARIIGLEPDPSTFARLKRAVAPLPAVEVYPWAATDRSGTRPFRQERESWGSSLSDTADPGTVDVEAVSLEDLIERLGIDRVDLLKLDVEGAEWQILTQRDALGAVRVIVGELHFGPGGRDARAAERALADFDVQITSRTPTHANFVARRRNS